MFKLLNRWVRTVSGPQVVALAVLVSGAFSVVVSTPRTFAYSPEAFVLTVDTRLAAEDNTLFIIPTQGEGYNYTVDCDDDGPMAAVTSQTGDYTCTYDTPGEYTVVITGDMPHFYLDAGFYAPISYKDNAASIVRLEQWGSQKWRSMSGMFAHAKNMTFSPSAGDPDLSNVTEMAALFYGAEKFNSDISRWNTSGVTNMLSMFSGALEFNQDISSWDMSGAISTEGMFSYAIRFNQDISGWNTSSVKYMREMFASAFSFNQDISRWDVRNVEEAGQLFHSAYAFNQDLSAWRIPSLQYPNEMFSYSRMSRDNYDKLLNSWSRQPVQSDVYFSSNKLYCGSSQARDILTNAPNNWTMPGGMDRESYNCSQPNIQSVQFSTEANEKIMTIQGTDLLYGIEDEDWIYGETATLAAYGGSMLEINGQKLPACAQESGKTENEWRQQNALFVRDSGPCVYINNADSRVDPAMTNTQVRVRLASDFDTNAVGIVTFFDAPAFSFNQASSTGQAPGADSSVIAGVTKVATAPQAPNTGFQKHEKQVSLHKNDMMSLLALGAIGVIGGVLGLWRARRP